MARNSSGTYTLVSGNPVITGTVIASTWANTTMPDIGNEITDSLSRSGKGGMLAPVKATNGTKNAPSYAFVSELLSGLYRAASNDIRMSVNQIDSMKWTAAGVVATAPLSSTAGALNLKTTTALSDAAAVLTAAQLVGGRFTITPTEARVITTDTAANIITALAGSVDGSNFDFTVVNLDDFDVTVALGVGVTLVGSMVVNGGAATFSVVRLSGTTVSVTRLETGASAGKANLTGADFTGAVAVAAPLSSTAGAVNLITNTALSNAAATLTAAQLIGGEFTITPTVARIQTLDTAANIISALSGSVTGSNFTFSIVNLAAFDVTIATATGVTLVGNMVVNNGNAAFRVTRLGASTVSVTRLETGSSSTPQIMIVRDEKANSTAGGTFTSGAWRTRSLNDVTKNSIAGASLSSNRITLPAGTYKITASAPAYEVDNHVLKLANITDSSDALIGTTERINDNSIGQTRSFICDTLVLTAEKVLELQHRCSQTSSSFGFGNASNFGVLEIYSIIKIEKIG